MTIQALLGIGTDFSPVKSDLKPAGEMAFSMMFFSDIRKDITSSEKYDFITALTQFADQSKFTAVYLPERHFHEFGAIFPNSAVMAAYLIPQTKHIRFRTAGVSLPLHHPAEVVEWWAMNDILSNGRVDLGFGSGWNKPDFIYAPNNYDDRREKMTEQISIVKRLWAGESVEFEGPDNAYYATKVYPRPIQKSLKVWMLVAQNDKGFEQAGASGYNVFTMLYGADLASMERKISIYRAARERAGFDPETGEVTLMLHTLIGDSISQVKRAVENPFKAYIRSAMEAHLASDALQKKGAAEFGEQDKDSILEYAFQRYFKTGALFGTVEDGKRIVKQAQDIGVNEIACLMDFGVDYASVKDSLLHLEQLVAAYTGVK
ncbi:LLM class flavin-dependent oxidoreductase [Alkalimonas collagenimarina]|uniref:LLM class flavin-dependent oxidoreductase n=1 Tax=Alkalimonas collagenimarina TaxID=400390 RepID=A0ABT9H0Y9_9GAMM|nr:MupA/Atu3671 family FMN-dependent luciferase-like monooxygenase [Alkalimonas collagenimarina]MDP4536955.1 LLM class flavin-dependent oxidoreductase [Alkalimonas collagenimarina]